MVFWGGGLAPACSATIWLRNYETLERAVGHIKDNPLSGTARETSAWAITQNLLFRDADDFLVGVTQERQRMVWPADEPTHRWGDLSGFRAGVYDLGKKMVLSKTFSVLPTLPLLGAPQGREWAAWGGHRYENNPNIQTSPGTAPLLPNSVMFAPLKITHGAGEVETADEFWERRE
ncbi:hypothetical protein CLCR_07633 [Cladophialophora carrionii]|uniref:Uncharacterized protein n=1 Tax=Cladophialophora carrionii TaxID=86049 RepID=A0A1C1CM87_9EURO|nr:hypothetical protein CLCR_07633 [Cladophialophora carrionii]